MEKKGKSPNTVSTSILKVREVIIQISILLSPFPRSTHPPTHTLIIVAAYADHTKDKQLTIKTGDIVGRVEDNSDTWIVSCLSVQYHLNYKCM